VTTLIPESWELPTYLAGDLHDMRDYRRPSDPEPSWWSKIVQRFKAAPEETGPNARILDFQQPRKTPAKAQPSMSNMVDWQGFSNIEPYDPEVHKEPAELYSQDALDALEQSGFGPHDRGVWHRSVTNEAGEEVGASHVITHQPGYRRPGDKKRLPWHLTTVPETVSVAFSSLRGPYGAIAAADEDAEQIKKIPKHAGLYLVALLKTAAGRTPGQGSADDWLERNSPESFEHDPREDARRWMEEHAHEYDEWHPETSDYTYPDVGDAAGQRWDEGGEAHATALPGHFQDENRAMGAPEQRGWSDEDLEAHEHVRQRGRQLDSDDEEDLEDYEDPDGDNLAAHGFNWEPVDSTAGTRENPISPDTPGKYVKHQIDLEGKHVATHTITPGGNRPGQWSLHTELGDHGLPVTLPTSVHGDLNWALEKYKRNSAEAMLPKYGYESTNGGQHWTRTDPSPQGHTRRRDEDYEHEIFFPEHGFMGNTINHTRLAHHSFAPNGAKAHNSDDLTDVVREQQRLAQGIHPGGRQDHRLTPDEFKADPSVSRLGHQFRTDTSWGDGKLTNMSWHLPTPEHPSGLSAHAEYNWDTGNYDFKYRDHHGGYMAPTHNYVPDGAPVTIPGRQTTIPLESAR